MERIIAELLYPLAESIIQDGIIPSLSSSSSSSLSLLASDDLLLHNILDTFLLNFLSTSKNDSQEEIDNDEHSPHSIKTIHSNIIEQKDKYFELLKLFLTKIAMINSQKSQPSNLIWSSLLGKQPKILKLYTKTNQTNLSTLLFVLRNGKVTNIKELCIVLLSIKNHFYHEELSQVLYQIITTKKHSLTLPSNHLACIHAYLIITSSLSSSSSSASMHSYVSPIFVIHSQNSTFLTFISFIVIWSSYFQLSDDDHYQILFKMQSLFNSMSHHINKENYSEEFDPIAIYLIRKWLHSHITSGPTSQRAIATEVIQRLTAIENCYFGKDCPNQFLLNCIPLRGEGLTNPCWNTLIARNDLEEKCQQKMIESVTSKKFKIQEKDGAEESQANDRDDDEEEDGERKGEGGEEDQEEKKGDEMIDPEIEWRGILRGKKHLNTKEKKSSSKETAKLVSDEIENEENEDEGAEDDYGVGFILDTKGDHSILDGLNDDQQHNSQESAVQSSNLSSQTESAVEVELMETVVIEKKTSRRKRKETVDMKEEKENEEKTETREVAAPEKGEEKTRKSKRTRK